MVEKMERVEVLRQKLSVLQTEHHDLDVAITSIAESKLPDQLTLQRLKKKKLALRDAIRRIEDELTPDIIA